MSRPIETVLDQLLPPAQIVFKVAVYGADWEKANRHNGFGQKPIEMNLRKTGDVHICKMMSADPKASVGELYCLFRGWTELMRKQISGVYT